MNPYSPPAASMDAPPSPAYGTDPRAVPTEATVELLRQTRPWVVFLGVMAFIGTAFMLLGGLGSIALGLMGGRETAPMAMLGMVYIPLALLYVYPGLKLWGYGSAINRLTVNRSPEDLEAALAHQKSFWKFAGITTIVMMVLYFLVFVFAMIAGVLGASRMH
jgi:Family of unknown function (DUF5362)